MINSFLGPLYLRKKVIFDSSKNFYPIRLYLVIIQIKKKELKKIKWIIAIKNQDKFRDKIIYLLNYKYSNIINS